MQADDYIVFKITGSRGATLACRVRSVRRFDSFAAMLEECGVAACLPGTSSVEDGAALYRSFGTTAGSYADLEVSCGVVGVSVEPLG